MIRLAFLLIPPHAGRCALAHAIGRAVAARYWPEEPGIPGHPAFDAAVGSILSHNRGWWLELSGKDSLLIASEDEGGDILDRASSVLFLGGFLRQRSLRGGIDMI